jgi:hypothetical protein
LNTHNFWKLLLVLSGLVVIIGLYAFTTLDVSISGDGIPNRPQQGPAEYPWGLVVPIIAIVGLSAAAAIYSFYKIFHRSFRLI